MKGQWTKIAMVKNCDGRHVIRSFWIKNHHLVFLELKPRIKQGCVFSMVIWPAFHIEKYRLNDHPYHAPQFRKHLFSVPIWIYGRRRLYMRYSISNGTFISTWWWFWCDKNENLVWPYIQSWNTLRFYFNIYIVTSPDPYWRRSVDPGVRVSYSIIIKFIQPLSLDSV